MKYKSSGPLYKCVFTIVYMYFERILHIHLKGAPVVVDEVHEGITASIH